MGSSFRGNAKGKALAANARVKITPIRIGSLDKLDLPCSLPCLDRLFPTDRGLHRIVQLIPDQIMHAVALGETLNEVLPMLPNAASQPRSNSYVQGRVSPICKDVNARLSFAHKGRSPGPCSSLPYGADRDDCHTDRSWHPASLADTTRRRSGSHWIPAFAGMTS